MKKGMQETIPTNVPNTVAVSADVAACDCSRLSVCDTVGCFAMIASLKSRGLCL